MKIIPQNLYAQKLYDNEVGLGTDSAVSRAILNTLADLISKVINKPTGVDIAPIKTDHDHKASTESSLKDVKRLYEKQDKGAASTSLVLLGESHVDNDDKERANKFITEIGNGHLTPNIVVFERGMAYPTPAGVTVIRESNLTTVSGGDFGMGLSAKQRSMVIGGYLALIVASGNQLDINKILIFFGANHKDILTYFEYYARHSATYIEKEIRYLFSIRSHVK